MSIQALQVQLSGSLLLPGSAEYEQARRGWNRSIDHRPALILLANTAQDIALGVRYARAAGLGVAVQLTGHGIQQPADDALLIVTTAMAAVQVDAKAQTACVAAGATWQHVLDQATPHGLAPLLGTAPHVSVIGYTLGGGIGWLARRYGFAADHVRWIAIVTADGVLRRASPTEHPELFWGLRGGGGNFGVVTAIAFDLFPVATVYGGNLLYPGELAGAALIQPWLDWHAPLSNTFGELPFAAIGTINNDPVGPAAVYGSNEMLDHLSDAAIELIVRYTTNSASPLVFSELRHAGGAIARNDPAANAIGNRDALLYFQTGGPTPTAEDRAASIAYIAQYKAELHAELRGGVYLNFMGGDERASARRMPTCRRATSAC